jgi:hypothetical protein
MRCVLVTILLIALLTAAGCSALQGALAGATDELQAQNEGREDMPGVGADTQSKIGYLVGAAGVLAFGLFIGGKKKKS